MLKKMRVVLFIIGFLMLAAGMAFADFDVFLKIEGVAGKSSVNPHETDWTQILGMAHPSRMASGAAGGRGARTGKVEYDDFSIVKEVDKATPKLGDAITSGEVMPKVTLEFRRVGGDKQIFLKIIMTDVKIVGLRPAGSSGRAKMERVTFKYKTLKWVRVSDD